MRSGEQPGISVTLDSLSPELQAQIRAQSDHRPQNAYRNIAADDDIAIRAIDAGIGHGVGGGDVSGLENIGKLPVPFIIAGGALVVAGGVFIGAYKYHKAHKNIHENEKLTDLAKPILAKAVDNLSTNGLLKPGHQLEMAKPSTKKTGVRILEIKLTGDVSHADQRTFSRIANVIIRKMNSKYQSRNAILNKDGEGLDIDAFIKFVTSEYAKLIGAPYKAQEGQHRQQPNAQQVAEQQQRVQQLAEQRRAFEQMQKRHQEQKLELQALKLAEQKRQQQHDAAKREESIVLPSRNPEAKARGEIIDLIRENKLSLICTKTGSQGEGQFQIHIRGMGLGDKYHYVLFDLDANTISTRKSGEQVWSSPPDGFNILKLKEALHQHVSQATSVVPAPTPEPQQQARLLLIKEIKKRLVDTENGAIGDIRIDKTNEGTQVATQDIRFFVFNGQNEIKVRKQGTSNFEQASPEQLKILNSCLNKNLKADKSL